MYFKCTVKNRIIIANIPGRCCEYFLKKMFFFKIFQQKSTDLRYVTLFRKIKNNGHIILFILIFCDKISGLK